MNLPERLPEKQEQSLLFVRTTIQSRNLQVLSYSYELGTGSLWLIFGIKGRALGKVVIREDGKRIWLATE
jgi:hypothetical protein